MGDFIPGHAEKLRGALYEAAGGTLEMKSIVEKHLKRKIIIPERLK